MPSALKVMDYFSLQIIRKVEALRLHLYKCINDTNIEVRVEKRFIESRKQTEEICRPLEIEDYVVQPHPDISPPKWHLGHTTWFLEELVLNKFTDNYQFYNPTLRKIYNSYYKGLGEHWVQAKRGELSRPTVKEVYTYRANIDEKIYDLIQKKRNDHHLQRIIEVAINHEEQHQELLMMDIKNILAANPLNVVYHEEMNPLYSQSKRSWHSFNEGLYEIGSRGDKFSYDIENPRHRRFLQAFRISNSLVTNKEYLEFINDGGYKNPKLWLSKGLDWVNEGKITAPLYWSNKDGQWFEFTMNGKKELDLKSPVGHVSYYEADAYDKWSGKRLPSEEEFEVAQLGKQELWCWTKSPFAPYPGYRPFSGEIAEYNGKFMCNQYVMKGGCFATPDSHYRPSYRNFFEPHQRWMFSGILLAEDRL